MTTDVLKRLCGQISWCEPGILEATVELALEIAREGREGRRIGTLFTFGNAEAVLAASRPLILDPLAGHAPGQTHITDPDLRDASKPRSFRNCGYGIGIRHNPAPVLWTHHVGTWRC